MGIQRSVDSGNSWKKANKGLEHQHIRWLALHDEIEGLVFAGTEPAGIFVSKDNGETWNGKPEVSRLRDEYNWMLPYSPEAGCIRGFAVHGDKIYASVEVGGLLVSEDAGETWRLVKGSEGRPSFASTPKGFVHSDVHSIEVHPSDPDLIFAPTGGGLYRSDDGGASWDFLYNCYCRAAWIDPHDHKHIIFGPADGVGRNGRIEESKDGGKTWEDIARNLVTPWAHTMPERFYQIGKKLFCVLDDGRLLVAELKSLNWKFIPGIVNVNSICKKY
jgi:photosystem II stability/assembly factor-like uncharacterized protein